MRLLLALIGGYECSELTDDQIRQSVSTGQQHAADFSYDAVRWAPGHTTAPSVSLMGLLHCTT